MTDGLDQTRRIYSARAKSALESHNNPITTVFCRCYDCWTARAFLETENNQKMRAFIAEQCNAMMDYAKAQDAASVTQEQMSAFVTEAMKPWALVLDRIGTALDNHGTRLTALEQTVEAISHCPAIESDVPHFQRPNGGR